MESPSAAAYLRPSPFTIALAAATATLGDLHPPAYPLLHHLVTTPPAPFSTLLHTLHQIPFTPNPTLSHQHGLPLSPTIRTVDQALRAMLDALLRSPHALLRALEFLEPQSDPAMHGVYEPDGPLSCHLRRVVAALLSLSFHALARLLHDLRLYVHPHPARTLASYTPRAPPLSSALPRAAVKALGRGKVVPGEDFTALTNVYKQARERVCAGNMALYAMGGLGTGRRGGSVVGAEYVAHLEAGRRRDFSAAADALHRYFDLSLADVARARGGDGETADASGHQYAALSLGVMHARFGHREGAAVALEDTVRAAQACGDGACQARALSWIARTSAATARRHQLLRHAGEGLALAREEICAVFTPVCEGVPEGAGIGRGGMRTSEGGEKGGVHEIIAARRMRSIRGRVCYRRKEQRVEALLVSAAAWEAHAAVPTALVVARMAMRCAGEGTGLSAAKANATAAVAALMVVEGDYEGGVELLRKAAEGRAVPAVGEEVLASSNEPELETLSRCLTWLQFEHSVAREDVTAATRTAESLSAFASSAAHGGNSSIAEDLELDALEAHCRLELLRRAAQSAVRAADTLCRRAARVARPARVVDGLRLRAEAHLQAGSYASALPAVLAAVSLSHGLGLSAAHVRAVLTLAETILRLEEGEREGGGKHALAAMTPVLGQALGGMGVRVRGRAYRLQAECLGGVGDKVVEMLRLGGEGDRECLYLLAQAYHERGEVMERNEAARRFLQTGEEGRVEIGLKGRAKGEHAMAE